MYDRWQAFVSSALYEWTFVSGAQVCGSGWEFAGSLTLLAVELSSSACYCLPLLLELLLRDSNSGPHWSFYMLICV